LGSLSESKRYSDDLNASCHSILFAIQPFGSSCTGSSTHWNFHSFSGSQRHPFHLNLSVRTGARTFGATAATKIDLRNERVFIIDGSVALIYPEVMAKEQCSLCRFWRPCFVSEGVPMKIKSNCGRPDHEVGTCHRRAPTSPLHSGFPSSFNDDWCGEFKTQSEFEAFKKLTSKFELDLHEARERALRGIESDSKSERKWNINDWKRAIKEAGLETHDS
jgi:hypothetical protein